MNNKTQTYRAKGRAVFLAAIMVLSVVAMSATFAGSAAAANGSSSIGNFSSQVITADDTELTVENVDIQGSSDGQVAITNATGNVVGVANGLSPADYDGSTDGSDDVVVQIAVGELDPTPAAAEEYTAHILDDGDASTGDDAENLSPEDSFGPTDIAHQRYVVTDFEAPNVAFDGQQIELSATVENIGVVAAEPSGENEQTLELFADNVSDSTARESVGSTTVALGGGDSTTFTTTVSTSTLEGNNASARVDYEVEAEVTNSGSGLADLSVGTQSTFIGGPGLPDSVIDDLIVGTDDPGSITVNVQDASGDPINNATVTLEDGFGNIIRQDRTGANNNVITFNNLAVAGDSDPAAGIPYGITANKDEFSSRSAQEELYVDDEEPNNVDVTRVVTLQSALEPNVFGVGAVQFDQNRSEDSAVITGDTNTSALFANGEFDNQAEFAVFTQTQSENNPTLTGDQEVTVNLWVSNRTGDKGDNPLEIVTNQTDENTTQNRDGTSLQITIDASSPTANIDDNGTTDEYNYETFNITATNATQSNVDPLRTEEFFAWSDDIDTVADDNVDANMIASELVTANPASGDASAHEPPVAQISDQPLAGPVGDDSPVQNFGSNRTDTTTTPLGPAVGNRDTTTSDGDAGIQALVNDVFFFVEGDRSTQHEVVDVDNLEPVENATVWAAYEGGPQDYEDIKDFQNAQGESFLVAEHAPAIGDDQYIINGLVADADFNVYVNATGYDRFNSTKQGLPLSGNQFIADWELDEVIESNNEGGNDRYEMAHGLSPVPLAYDLDVEVFNSTSGNYEKRVAIQDGSETDVRVTVRAGDIGADESTFDPIGGKDVDLEIVPDPPGFSVTTAGDLEGQDSVTLSTDANGQANVTFEAFNGISATQNITASTTNADGTEYNTTVDDPRDYNDRVNQSQIEVFTTGTITGDIVDDTDASRNVAGADVFLFADDDLDGNFETFVTTVTSGDTGSYRFEDLQTTRNFRVEANITFEVNGQDETFEGFNNVGFLNAGTNGGEDVVLQNLNLSQIQGSGDNWFDPYVDNNDVVTNSGLNQAVQDNLGGSLSDARLNAVIQSYLTGNPIQNS